jgi:hypothetical protein
MHKRWMFKSGSTAIVDGAANLLCMDTSKNKVLIRSIDDKFFILAFKHTNYVDLYAFSQYETNVLPTDLFIIWKQQYPNVVLDRPPSKRAERIFDKDYRN